MWQGSSLEFGHTDFNAPVENILGFIICLKKRILCLITKSCFLENSLHFLQVPHNHKAEWKWDSKAQTADISLNKSLQLRRICASADGLRLRSVRGLFSWSDNFLGTPKIHKEVLNLKDFCSFQATGSDWISESGQGTVKQQDRRWNSPQIESLVFQSGLLLSEGLPGFI